MAHAAPESPLSVDDNPWDGEPHRLVYAGCGIIGVGLLGIASCLIADAPNWINFGWVALAAFGAFTMLYGGNILRDRVDSLIRAGVQPERTSANTSSRRWAPLGEPEAR